MLYVMQSDLVLPPPIFQGLVRSCTTRRYFLETFIQSIYPDDKKNNVQPHKKELISENNLEA